MANKTNNTYYVFITNEKQCLKLFNVIIKTSNYPKLFLVSILKFKTNYRIYRLEIQVYLGTIFQINNITLEI